MKKILSILLSVMLILGTLSVLMMLPASATTGSENAVGPVNLIENGDGVGTPYYSAEDGAPNLEDYTDASWQDIGKYFTYNNANGAVSYYPVGWRTTGTQYANLDYRSLRNQYVNNVDKYTYTSYDDPADPYALSVNALQQAYQDFVIEAGKYYTVSADLTVVPTFFKPEDSNKDGDLTAEYEAWISTWTADMFVDTLCWGNEGELDISETGITTHKTGRNPSGKVPTGYDWNLVNTDEERAAINAHLQSGMGKGFTAADGKVYHNSGDFKTYSFTFSADEFIAANSGIKNNGDGTYTVRLVIRNGISQTRLAFDNVMVYENAAVEAAAGGVLMVGEEKATSFIYIPGEEISVTAVPYYGNSFAYWRDAEDNKYYDITYTGEAKSLVAVFNNYNQFPDGNFESGTTVVKDTIDSLTLHTPAKKRVIETVNVPAGSDPTKHGEKMLHVSLEDNTENPANGTTCQRLFTLPVEIKPETTYVFSYSYYQDDTKAWVYNHMTTSPGGWSADVSVTDAQGFHVKEGTNITATSKGYNYSYAPSTSVAFNFNQNQMTVSAWHDVRIIFTTPAASDAVFNGGSSAIVYMNFGCSFNTTNDFWVDNLCLAEATTTAPATSTFTAEGAVGQVELIGNAANLVTAYKVTVNAGNSAPQIDTPYYANISLDPYAATATADFGSTFEGWYKDGAAEPVSKNPTLNISASGSYVAKFSGNLIANGDYSDDDTSNVGIISTTLATNTATYKTDGENANGYVTLETDYSASGTEMYAAFRYNFPVKKNTKYFISYKMRSPVDTDGNFISTTYGDASSSYPSAHISIRTAASYGWGSAGSIASGCYYKAGGSKKADAVSTASNYTDAVVGLNVFNTAAAWWHPSRSTSRANPGEWITVVATYDTSVLADSVFDADGNTTLAICIGAAGQSHMYLDVDEVYAAEYTDSVALYEYTAAAEDGGTAYVNRYGTADIPVTYTATVNEGYEFLGWYEDDATEAISTELTYVPTNAVAGTVYNLTAKFTEIATETEVVVNSDFEDETISSAYTYTSTSSAVIADHDTAAEDYTADLGSKYLKVTNMTDDNAHCDFAIPVNVTAGKKTVVHFKAKALSYNAEENTEDSNAGARWDIRVDDKANGWSTAKNVSGKIVVSDSEGTAWNHSYDAWHQYQKTDGDGNPVYEEDGETPVMVTAGGVSAGTTSDIGLADNYNDVYVMLDATADQTVYVHFGYRNGAEFAIDNVWVYDEDELVSLNGATPDVDIDDNQKIAYVTELKFPTGLATNKISTYVAPYTRLSQDAPDYLYNFTDELNAYFAEAGEPRIVSKARVTADESGLIKNEGVAFTNGKTYAEFDMGDTFNYTTKYAVRSEIALADTYGNDLGFTISTNNGEEGLYVRSANQLKRIIAKALISEKEVMPFDIEITPVEGKSRWNADITQVWKFVLKYKNHLG